MTLRRAPHGDDAGGKSKRHAPQLRARAVTQRRALSGDTRQATHGRGCCAAPEAPASGPWDATRHAARITPARAQPGVPRPSDAGAAPSGPLRHCRVRTASAAAEPPRAASGAEAGGRRRGAPPRAQGGAERAARQRAGGGVRARRGGRHARAERERQRAAGLRSARAQWWVAHGGCVAWQETWRSQEAPLCAAPPDP